MKTSQFLCLALVAGAVALAGAQRPTTLPLEDPSNPCYCPLPEGQKYFGKGDEYVANGCTCENACEFAKPSGKPSCAALCKCPDYGKFTKITLQTYTTTRGPLVATFTDRITKGRRMLAAGEQMFVTA